MSAMRCAGVFPPGYESSRSSATTEVQSASVSEPTVDSILESIVQDVSVASEASSAVARAWATLQSTQFDVARLERDSAAAEVKQLSIKEHFRKLLSDDFARKASEEKRVRELEETIADLKMNLTVKQRMVQKLGKGDQLGNEMAVLGGGSHDKKASSSSGTRRR
jgi:hypothetical protein